MSGARIGLFSTLTGPGSRALVASIAGACGHGRLADVGTAFLFVNRSAGESDVTDASVEAIEDRFGIEVIRASAVGFRKAERKEARDAAAAGDPAPLLAWREAFYASFRDRLPATDLDLLLGDMWIWSPRECAERRGVNLHPALPGGPAGKMWFDVIWDLIAGGAVESGIMLHRVTPEVDLGPVVSYCRYSLRTPGLEDLWRGLPPTPAQLGQLVSAERARKRDSTHPLFDGIRARGVEREVPLMLATVAAVADGRIAFRDKGVVDAAGDQLPSGADLTLEVEAALGAPGAGEA